MNQAIFRRLMWKEYRLQRSFWIAMAVLALMLMFYAWEFIDRSQDRAEFLFSLALGVPLFYGLGCASTIFAGEHDAGTYEFQRSLPITVLKVFGCKITFAVISTAAMCAFLLILSIVMGGGNRLSAKEIFVGTMYLSTIIWLYMAWGVFFSLLMKRPLLAAVLAVSIASLCLPLVVDSFPSTARSNYNDFIITLIIAGMSAIITLIDFWLGRRWFFEKMRPVFRLKELLKSKTVAIPETLVDYLSSPKRWNMILRLGWQHWRQSAWLAIVVVVMLIPVTFTAFFTWQQHRHGPLNNPDWRVYSTIYIILALAMPPLIGSFTFLGDQRRMHYRFFAERGIGPRTVWLSRMWPWLVIAPCILVLLTILIAPIFFAWPWNYMRPDISPILSNLFGFIVLGICAGQLCSMFFRSGILAGLFGLILAGILAGWLALMSLWGISWLWSVAPIPVVLLLATWLRAPDWVLERNKLRSWLWPALVLIVPAVFLLIAVPMHRLTEIPVVGPGFDPDHFFRPLNDNELTTLDIYKKALEKYSELPKPKSELTTNDYETETINDSLNRSNRPNPLTAEEIAWVEANQEVIPLAIEASKGQKDIFSPISTVLGYEDRSYYAWDVYKIGKLLICSARILQSAGHLDAAKEKYLAVVGISRQLRSGRYNYGADELETQVYNQLPFWADQAGQTAEKIKKAIDQLEELTVDMPAGSRQIKFKYMETKEDLTEGFQYHEKSHMSAANILWLKIPWERARALRLLNLLTRRDLEDIAEAESAAKEGRPIAVSPDGNHPYYWVKESPYALREEIILPPFIQYTRQSKDLIVAFADMENHRRATPIVLALQAWKLEHGSFPKTLNELVGPYLKHLPNDPYSGESYAYFPDGLNLSMPHSNEYFKLISPEQGRPFIWSMSPNIAIKITSDNHTDYKIYDYYATPDKPDFYYWRWLRSNYDLYSHGHFFLVP